jgi:nicotinamidase-related amidase
MDTTRLALLLVDIQRDFWGPLATEPMFATFPANIRTLLATARARGLLIVHTQAAFQPDESDWMLFYRPQGRGAIPCIAGSAGVAIEDFAAPQESEPIIRKQTFDGFLNTQLEQVLRERNIRAVLVAGLVTSACVLFTAASAYQRRIVPVVVTDACADVPEHHEAALRMYGGLCFKSISTRQVHDDLASVVDLAGRFVDRRGFVQARDAVSVANVIGADTDHGH